MSPTTRGHLAVAVAVLIWAGWIVAVRGAVATLGPVDLAVLRYLGPALLLAPVWWRLGLAPRGVSRGRLLAMVLGWGAPFALLGAAGLRHAEVGLFVALVPGMMPLWLAGLSALLLAARPTRTGALGLGLIAAAGALALAAAPAGALAGAPYLALASIGWATYALAFRGSGLTPLQATAVVGVWSTLLLIPVALAVGLRLPDLTPAALAGQFMAHGVLSGVVSVAAFAMAVRDLGAARAAGFAALVPAVATLGGWVWLGEAPSAPGLLAVGLATVGVALVSAPPRAAAAR